MADDNIVNIYVFDESGAALNVMGWPVTFDEGVSNESIDLPTPTLSWESETCFTIHFATNRTRAQWVAASYMNAGYGIPASSAWPDNQPINGDNPMQSACMSVHGEFDAPQTLNFYLPVTITTPQGLVMRLLLGQNGEGGGRLQTAYGVCSAAGDIVDGCTAVLEDDPVEAVMAGVSFIMDVADLIGHNPWYVTAIGTQEFPAATIQNKNNPRLLCLGRTDAGQIQAGCFSPGYGDYSFSLRIIDIPAS